MNKDLDNLRNKINSELDKNELFQKSNTPFKYIQGERYFKGDEFRNGSEASPYIIDGLKKTVIFTYKDGYLQSIDNNPAIQWDGHWEYWEKGMLVKVVDNDGDVEEYWEYGVPVRIERNLIQRRANGENI